MFYLIVPVGEGQGLLATCSTFGMSILRGANAVFFLGEAFPGLCVGGGGVSSTREWNTILILVLGKRSMHLKKQNMKTITHNATSTVIHCCCFRALYNCNP